MDHCGNTNTNSPVTAGKPTIVHAICVLAFATECGTDANALAARSGIRLDLICQIADNMRNAGLWSDDNVDQSEWWDATGEFNAKAYFGQALCAIGRARRIMTAAGAEYVGSGETYVKR